MKKTVMLIMSVVAVSATSMYGQGSFAFNNYLNAPAPAPVVTLADGKNVGSDYSASLFWAQGTGVPAGSLALFSSATVSFFGTTGGSPGTDGAGLFDNGLVVLPTTGVVSLQVRAWKTGAGVTGWDNASIRGESNVIPLTLATGTTPPPNMDGLQSFTVQIVPEPSSLALLGLGTAAMLFFRRRN